MSEEIPRRQKPKNAPEMPRGYRSSRRASKSAKSAKHAIKKQPMLDGMRRGARLLRNVGYYAALVLGTVLVGVLIMVLLFYGINAAARWNAVRVAAKNGSRQELEKRSKENVLVIGVQDGKATGFLALRVDLKGDQVFGVAIPDGAFIEVPGQGFEKIGESYAEGAQVSLSAISNYLTVPFHTYVVVPAAVYSDAMKNQSLANVASSATSSSLTPTELTALAKDLSAISQGNTAIVPLPVKPIKLGNQTYFEPQRAEVADLLKSWWGVDASKAAALTRVILYNGAGVPGVAGEAAQQIIRGGFRVVDTKNADNFDYITTKVVVQRGDVKQGEELVRILGVGTVERQPSEQNVADVIVIIGKDYKPPVGGATGGTK
ncbi:MAG: LytR C-terminal domain-containing protein [Coriobacteriia bacterium]